MVKKCGVPPHVLSLQTAPGTDLVKIGLSVDGLVGGDTSWCKGEFLETYVPPAQGGSVRALFHTHFAHVLVENVVVVRSRTSIPDDGCVEVSESLHSPVNGSGRAILCSRSSCVKPRPGSIERLIEPTNFVCSNPQLACFFECQKNRCSSSIQRHTFMP